MKIEKLKKISQLVTEDIICNKCGKSCKSTNEDYYGLIETSVTGGYYSTHLEDMTTYTFSLCEVCLRGMFKSFKVKPKEETQWLR